MSYNTPKIINVFYKEDRKPYDVNGKAISYFGEDFIGANDATKIRFYFTPSISLTEFEGAVHAKRADGELRYEILTKSSDNLGNYLELSLNAWFTGKVGKVTLSVKIYSGDITYGYLVEGEPPTSIESLTNAVIVASDVFSFNVGYAPNATEVAPPFDDTDIDQFLTALSQKASLGQTIYVVPELPENLSDYDNQWFLVKSPTGGNVGKLFHINLPDAEEVELGVEQLNLTPSGNGDVVSGDVRGQVKWNADLGTISFGLYDDVEIGAGDTLFWFVKAQSNIAKGDVVQFAGNVGGEVLVKKAVFAEITAQPDLLMGVAKHAIVEGNKGYIISAGRLNNISTSGFTTPILYLSTTTAGLLTSTKPTSGFKGSISAVGRFSTSGSNGFLLVRPNLIKGVGELTDVTFTGVANGDVLEYQNGQWINGTFVKNQLNLLGNEVFTLQSEMDEVEGRLDVVEPIVDQHTTDISDLDNRIDFIEDNGGIDFIKVADFASLPTSGDVRNHRLFLTQDTNKLYEFDGTSFNEVRQDKLTADSGEEDGLVEVVFGTTISHSGTSDATALQVIQTSTVGEGNIIEALNSSGIQFQVAKDGTVNAYGDLTIAGNLTVSGTTTTVNTAVLDVEDNIITINKNQTGTPESTLLSGIEVERGDETNFQFVFQESSDLFKVGQVGDLQAVATREDSPTDKGVAFFNTSTNKFETSGNLKVNTSGQLEDVVVRNSAVGVAPLIVNGLTSTSTDLQRWQVNGTTLTRIDVNGHFRTTRVANQISGENSYLDLLTTGSVIRRNVADGNHALIVNNANASSTGNIANFQFASANKLEVTKDGFLNQNGTRLFHQTGGDTNTFFGNLSGNTNVTGSLNTGFGRTSLFGLSSGVGNTAFGQSSGRTITTGSNNTFLGNESGFTGAWGTQLVTASNSTALGYQAFTDKSNQMVFGNASVTEFKFDRNASSALLLRAIEFTGGSQSTSIYKNATDSSIRYYSVSGGVGADRLAILPNGNLGIGTTNPTERLQIGTNFQVTSTGVTLWGNNSENGALTWDTGKAIIGGRVGNALDIRTDNTVKMHITTGGNVGIGTTAPDKRLEVRTPLGTEASFRLRQSEQNFWDFIIPATNDVLTIRDVGGEKLRITSAGNVGIGTTAPASNLTVEGSGYRTLRIRTTNTTTGGASQLLLMSGGTTEWFLSHRADTFGPGAGNFTLGYSTGTTASSVLNANATGLVGINETSPTAQLQVKSGATTRVPLIVDTLASHAQALQEWKSNGTNTALVNAGGRFRTGEGVSNLSSSDNSYVNVATTGTIITRNIADSNPSLIVNNVNASATSDITRFQKAGTTQSFVDNRGVFYKNETKLTLTEPTFTEVSTGNFEYTITEAQINANDVIEITKTSSAINQTYRVKVPNNSKQVRIWFRPIANHSGMLAEVELTKVANEFVEYYFDDQQINGVSLLPTDTSNYINFNPNNYQAIFVYKNINGTQKMLSVVSNMEI
jgi:hypothetical protein